MGDERNEEILAEREAIKEAAFAKAKKIHDDYEDQIEELKQRRLFVDRECGAQVKASNEAVVDNNSEIVRLNTLLEKAKAKEIKLSFREKSEMAKQLKERRANQETLMYEAIDLQEEYKTVMNQINDEIKALRREQGEKEVRAKYSGQYLKQVIETLLEMATKPYQLKDLTDNHSDLRKIDVQKITIILHQMAASGELVCEVNERDEKFYELPSHRKARLAAETATEAPAAVAEAESVQEAVAEPAAAEEPKAE